MRKIIKGKIYDTEKERLIAEYSNGSFSSDFRHEYEDLYLTEVGQFFIHAQGGPLTKYSESSGNSTWGIETIILLNNDQAYACLEKHNKINEIEIIFHKRFKNVDIFKDYYKGVNYSPYQKRRR